DVDTDFFVDGATGDLSGGITLQNTDTPDGLAHQLSFVSSGDISTADFVIIGTDADNKEITETVTGVTTTPVETTLYFKTVESITSVDDIGEETLDVGFVDEAVSKTYPLEGYQDVGAAVQLKVTGTINVDVEVTAANVFEFDSQAAIPWMNTTNTNLVAETADAFGSIEPGARALRIVVNSYSSGAEVQAYISQTRGSIP